MSNIVLQPASTGSAVTHYENTIESLVPLSRVRGHVSASTLEELSQLYPDGRAPIWGGC